MEPADFSGYATKAGLRCTDGRTIMPDAFKHQDKTRVPLVWQHGHTDPENVLGHVILENRQDGVYAYGFFNDSKKAQHTAGLLEHGDINMMSIWANQLIERSKKVMHGAIREVSLVLAGANPGALIESVTISHDDGEMTELDDEAIIYTGLVLEHSFDYETEDPTMGTEYEDDLEHEGLGPDATIQDVVDSMTEEQQTVMHYLIGEALESVKKGGSDSTDDSGSDSSAEHSSTNEQESTHMTNVFEKGASDAPKHTISHDDMKAIVGDAKRLGSLKEAIEGYALSHGITDIETLFPDAVSLDQTPQFLARRTEWVNNLLGGIRKSPFSRIKTITADLTYEEARAKGYVKGDMKKEEFFSVSKRTTTPTTVYKKQALDRDDVVDITDFDVVTWLKAEMRVMLDEELARAALMGDGRDFSSDDKINEQNIRPVAKDSELFTTTINVNIDDANSSVTEIIDAIITNRKFYKGTGLPNFYTSETIISKFLLLKDTLGRKIYKNLQEVADDLRCATIVPVEAMDEEPDLVGVIFNPADYVFGATAGGQVNMFDDFDIDYNKQKYLIETRVSGALTKIKAALVIRKVASSDVLVVPNMPDFDEDTGVLDITDQTGVVYKNGATVVNAAGSPYAAIASGASITIDATPAAGYYFPTSEDDSWTFTRN